MGELSRDEDDVADAVREGRDLVGIVMPLDGLDVRVPTYADAGGYPHFVPGGNTAMRSDAGFVMNRTREFVIDGGVPVRPGSMLFRLSPHGVTELLGVF